MTSQSLLQQLRHLDRSSSGFHDQLSDILYGEDYARCIPDLQGDDLAWLVDHLDEVCYRIAPIRLYLNQCRLSTHSILRVPVSGNVYASSNTYVAPG